VPLFGRTDGELVRGESPLRRIVPYVMRGRNESLVFHTGVYQVGAFRRWQVSFNRTRAEHATLFEFFLWTAARVLHARPRLNRFVSGGRTYQRRGVFLSFAARTALKEGSPLVTVKMEFPQDESFPACARRIAAAVETARAGRGAAGGELALAARLPGVLLRVLMAALRWADRLNLLPARLIAHDPLHASAFVANLGSLGLSDTSHHLYEFGTASVFAALGELVGETVKVDWTFDERVCDGPDCASALDLMRRLLEQPERGLDDEPAKAGVRWQSDR
jgi:hypothetical protein